MSAARDTALHPPPLSRWRKVAASRPVDLLGAAWSGGGLQNRSRFRISAAIAKQPKPTRRYLVEHYSGNFLRIHIQQIERFGHCLPRRAVPCHDQHGAIRPFEVRRYPADRQDRRSVENYEIKLLTTLMQQRFQARGVDSLRLRRPRRAARSQHA